MAADYEDDFDQPAPKARVSMLTVLLFFLNVAAALGFAYLLLMTYQKRQSWSYAVFLYDLRDLGLPLEMEADGPSASRETTPRKLLDPAQLKAAFQKRSTGVSFSEPFQAVDERFVGGIRPQHLTPEVLADVFKNLGPPVKTLEDEIRRLQKDLPADLDRAAKEVLDKYKTDAEKKAILGTRLLLPLAANTQQIEKLARALEAATGPDVDKLVLEAAKRKLLYDILAPLEVFRPGDSASHPLAKIGDLETKIDDFENLLKRRLESVTAEKYDSTVHFGADFAGQARDSVEKRQTIAYTLFAIAHVKKHDGSLLYPSGPERAQVVAGLHEYSLAAQIYAPALRVVEARVLDLLEIDRQGATVLKGGAAVGLTEGFVQRYQDQIFRIKELIKSIDLAQKRLDDLNKQQAGWAKLLDERQQQLNENKQKLLAARAETRKLQDDLRRLQKEVFDAQVQLADADRFNEYLLAQIIYIEALLKGEKGAKAP